MFKSCHRNVYIFKMLVKNTSRCNHDFYLRMRVYYNKNLRCSQNFPYPLIECSDVSVESCDDSIHVMNKLSKVSILENLVLSIFRR
mgnify:CR=1 FL=1